MRPKLARADVERINRSFYWGQVVGGSLNLTDLSRLAADCLDYMTALEKIKAIEPFNQWRARRMSEVAWEVLPAPAEWVCYAGNTHTRSDGCYCIAEELELEAEPEHNFSLGASQDKVEHADIWEECWCH